MKRGLRQCDLLSFSCLFWLWTVTCHGGKDVVPTVGNEGIGLSYFFYVGDEDNISNIVRVLRCFFFSSFRVDD